MTRTELARSLADRVAGPHATEGMVDRFASNDVLMELAANDMDIAAARLREAAATMLPLIPNIVRAHAETNREAA